MFEVSIKGATLSDVWVELAVAVGICVALGAVVIALAKRMERLPAAT